MPGGLTAPADFDTLVCVKEEPPPTIAGPGGSSAAGRPPAFEAKVLKAFLRDGKLVSIPARGGKRDVVLRYLFERCFAEDRVYPEREVNERLGVYHEDVAALRRYMVVAGLLTRAAGEYRRAVSPRATRTLVLMGVAGSGKSAVMAELARRLGWPAAEGDEFHSPENVAKMAAGVPLGDDDRRPWLLALAAWIGEREAAGEDALLTCSALRRSYRDLLRDGHASVRFVHLRASPDVLRTRIAARSGHYMPLSLLDSQLATLEPLEPDEPGCEVDADLPLGEVVADVLGCLGDRPA